MCVLSTRKTFDTWSHSPQISTAPAPLPPPRVGAGGLQSCSCVAGGVWAGLAAWVTLGGSAGTSDALPPRVQRGLSDGVEAGAWGVFSCPPQGLSGPRSCSRCFPGLRLCVGHIFATGSEV